MLSRQERVVIGMLVRKFVWCALMLCLLLTGCGNRGMPVIQQELLDKKLSVLMLTSPSLSDAAKQSIGAALVQWRNGSGIAFEWLKDMPALDEQTYNKIKAGTYNYIYVAGNELIGSVAPVIDSNISSSKWTLLQDDLSAMSLPEGTADHAAVLAVDSSQVDALKNKWVDGVLLEGASVEWVTRADRPIPSEWAPSEEADHIVLLDNNEQWYQQLAFQTKQHFSKYIIFYAPVDQAAVQKAKSLGAAVMDLSNAFAVELNWDAIMANRLAAMTQRQWAGGELHYNEQELKELKIK